MPAPSWLTAQPVAHRGLHVVADRVLENTPGAALAAVARGFAIECDVQLTADGEAVVFHDFTLDRLTGESGRIDTRTAAALAGIVFRDSDDRIPTLGDFLDLVGGRVPVVVEIKSGFDGNLALTRRVAEVVAGRDDPIALMSFDPAIVEALAELAPGRPRGITAEANYDHGEWARLPAAMQKSLGHLLHMEHSRPDFLAWHVKDLPHAAPNMARYFGMPVLTWTVRTPEDRETAMQYADQMIFEGFVP